MESVTYNTRLESATADAKNVYFSLKTKFRSYKRGSIDYYDQTLARVQRFA